MQKAVQNTKSPTLTKLQPQSVRVGFAECKRIENVSFLQIELQLDIKGATWKR